jgi:hypothetical protein
MTGYGPRGDQHFLAQKRTCVPYIFVSVFRYKRDLGVAGHARFGQANRNVHRYEANENYRVKTSGGKCTSQLNQFQAAPALCSK